MDAFDADVVIYAVVPGHPLGRRVRALFADQPERRVGMGSVLLLPEVLAKPLRVGAIEELTQLSELLSRLDLHPVDPPTAELAASLASVHRLQTADAAHLATAVVKGADRFITNNRKDFPTTIPDVAVTYPEMLA